MKATETEPVEGARSWEYDLKIDEQTERFLSSKQQLTYFLVTAAVVPIGFAMTLLKDRNVVIESEAGWALVSAGVTAGLCAVGAALVAIHLEHRSHRRHIANRYQHRAYDDLPPTEQVRWDRINRWASRFLASSFVFLLAEMPLLAVFLAVFVLS